MNVNERESPSGRSNIACPDDFAPDTAMRLLHLYAGSN